MKLRFRPFVRPETALRLCLIGALLVLSASVKAALVSFDQTGGDAWTFSKRVHGQAAEVCDEIWIRTSQTAVRARLENGRFEADVPISQEARTLRAQCWHDDQMLAFDTQQWTLRLGELPKAWIRTRVRDNAVWLDAGRSERAPGSPVALERFEWHARPGNPSPLLPVASDDALDSRPRTARQLQLQIPSVDGEYYVTLRVTDALGRTDSSTTVFRVEQGRAYEVHQDSDRPDWVERAIIYGVAPYFFGDGRFTDVAARLDEIAALGATALWLSPITDAPQNDFGYAVLDHFSVRDSFGTEDELRRLVDAAHVRGLRVILDFVPNHLSDRHPYHIDAERQGARSPYYGWFDRDADGTIEHYFDWHNLKNLDYDNPEVQNYMIAAAAYWVRTFDIDGFRVDASWAVANRTPEFWPRWRRELKRIKPDLLLLAEASAREPYHAANGFDAVYDWTHELGQWAWHDVFVPGEPVDLDRLRAAIANDASGTSPNALILRFLNNNDTGTRFLTEHGIELQRVATALKFTLPGIPLIYTGDEVGAEFHPYGPRPPIVWIDTLGLSECYRRLAALRRDLPALRSNDVQLVETSEDDKILAFVRGEPEAQDSVLVVLNFSAYPVNVAFADENLIRTYAKAQCLDAQCRSRLEIARSTLHIPAYGGAILGR